jgi:hypothetical protein
MPRLGRIAPVGIARGAQVAALTTLLAAGAVAASEPWPFGPPSHAELAEHLAVADELYDRERFEEYLEANERGEDREHIQVFQEAIDAGQYDLDRLFRFGDALFEHEFRNEDGLGASKNPPLQRVHTPTRGGLDTFSCAACHSQGGPNGASSALENAFVNGDGASIASANVRTAPHVLGGGLVQGIGLEMSRELALQRDAAIEGAEASGLPVTVVLETKGVEFGELTAGPDGSVDTSGVRGVSADLVVRPFGWKGDTARLRRFVEDAARIHFGVQAHTLALAHRDDPDPAHLGNGPWFDPDGDGVQRELEEGTITAGALYLALLEVPIVVPPSSPELLDRWARGSAHFDALGCGSCHKRTLRLDYSTFEEIPDSADALPIAFNLLKDGDRPRGSGQVELFSDLKRHDLGEELADPHENEQGIPRSEFLTRPLWGLAETAPFLHDGRAASIHEAIRAHGGDGAETREAYLALDAEERGDLAVFLLSLSRTPKLRVPR